MTLLRGGTKELMKMISPDATEMAHRLGGIISGGALFKELGFRYFGPIDGHNIENMLEIFTNVKSLRDTLNYNNVTVRITAMLDDFNEFLVYENDLEHYDSRLYNGAPNLAISPSIRFSTMNKSDYAWH